MQEQFRQAQEKYFSLRGKFDTGHLSQEQFDAALRDLMLQDKQGRYWMIGADSGKWYYYDGAKWVADDPYPGASSETVPPPRAAVPPPFTATSPTPPVVPAPAPPPSDARAFPLVPILIGAALLLAAAVAFFLFLSRLETFIAQPPPITPILPATITRAPSPTPLNAAQGAATALPPATLAPTQAALNPTRAAPTLAMLTAPPPVTVIVVTGAPPTDNAPPVLVPSVTPLLPSATAPPSATETPIVGAATSTPPVACPSGVCVSRITVSPAPKRNQPVTFTTTFVNATNETRYHNLVILVLDPNKTGSNKGFGESPALEVKVPPGTSDYSITYVVVTGPGGCISLYAQAADKLSPFDKPTLPSPEGAPYRADFEVC